MSDALYRLILQKQGFYSNNGSPSAGGGGSISAGTSLTYYSIPVSWSVTNLALSGAGQSISSRSGSSVQRQYEIGGNMALQRDRHEFRFGADFVALEPKYQLETATLSIASPGINALIAGAPLSATNFVRSATIGDLPIRASVFAQDTFRISPRWTLQAGLRWEITPPLSASALNNLPGYQYAGPWRGPGSVPSGDFSLSLLNNAGAPRWPMRYGQVAPRAGMAYRINAGLVLRLGAGLYYDPALSSLINIANYNLLEGWQYFAPLRPSSGAMPSPRQETLFLPKVWQWRASLEQSLGKAAQLSVSYFGSKGTHLLRPKIQLSPETALPLSLTQTSHARANYQSLNVQWCANWGRFFAMTHYTWAHSIDTGSSDTDLFLVSPQYRDAADRGASSFDVRHVASVAAGSALPTASIRGLRWLSRDWNVSASVQARTGFPFDVTSLDRSVGLGFANTGRPDLVVGQPLWLIDAGVPGGRRLNPTAFSAISEGSGTLGRNVLRGAPLTQVDASLRRSFRLFGEAGAEFSVSAYNLWNQRSFGNPAGYLGSALFGQPVSTASFMLGAGSPSGGLTPIFQAGAPRTVEFEFRIRF